MKENPLTMRQETETAIRQMRKTALQGVGRVSGIAGVQITTDPPMEIIGLETTEMQAVILRNHREDRISSSHRGDRISNNRRGDPISSVSPNMAANGETMPPIRHVRTEAIKAGNARGEAQAIMMVAGHSRQTVCSRKAIGPRLEEGRWAERRVNGRRCNATPARIIRMPSIPYKSS